MKLSIIIPVFNERHTVEKILPLIENVPTDKEIIVVDDLSDDGTREILGKMQNREKRFIRIIYHNRNMGKGAAIRTGLKYVTGDLVIVQDADREYNPMDCLKLIRPIEQGEADVVYVARFHKSTLWKQTYRYGDLL